MFTKPSSNVNLLGIIDEADVDVYRNITTIAVKIDNDNIVLIDIGRELLRSRRDFNTMIGRAMVISGELINVCGELRVNANFYEVFSKAETIKILNGEAVIIGKET